MCRGSEVDVGQALSGLPGRPDKAGPTRRSKTQVNLDAYLQRIGYSGGLEPSRDVLHALHLAHATHIPFENLDVLLGRPIRLDLESLQAKLVAGRRGGYCFEHNLLFASVLEQIGFTVTRLAARVRYRTSQRLPRTHMTLMVDVDGTNWLADVGFGADGLLLPVPLGSGLESTQFAWTYRVSSSGANWMLQSLRESGWADLYEFTLEPQHQVDYEMANHFTSTFPESRFVKMLTVQSMTTEAKTALRNRELTVDEGAATTMRTLADDAEVLAVLEQTFGLRVPADIKLP